MNLFNTWIHLRPIFDKKILKTLVTIFQVCFPIYLSKNYPTLSLISRTQLKKLKNYSLSKFGDKYLQNYYIYHAYWHIHIHTIYSTILYSVSFYWKVHVICKLFWYWYFTKQNEIILKQRLYLFFKKKMKCLEKGYVIEFRN